MASRRPPSVLKAFLTVIAMLAVACTSSVGGPSGGAPASEASTADASQPGSGSPSPTDGNASAVPVCGTRPAPAWVAGRGARPGDGVPDPAGRIVFGIITTERGDIGQVVRPLMAIDPDGSDLAQILDCDVSRPRFSRDGRRLAFGIVTSSGDWQLGLADRDGSHLRVISTPRPTREIDKYGQPDWSSDGASLVFGLDVQLWRIGIDGQHLVPVGPSDRFDAEPRVSPDGTSIVFLRGDFQKGVSEPWIRNLATGQERSVFADNHRELEHADWSPDGRWIVYNTVADLTGAHVEQVERMPVDDPTATPTVLYARPGVFAFKPTYSPDGRWILFGCGGTDATGGYASSLCVMAADGSDEHTLLDAPDGVEFNHFAWAPAVP